MALLTQEQGFITLSWLTLTASLKDSDPDTLQNIIDAYLTSNQDDVSNLTLRETTALLIEASEQCIIDNGSIEPLIAQVELSPSFPQTQPDYLSSVSALFINMQETRTDCGCDTDAYIFDTSLSDLEFIACMSECMDYNPDAGYCMDTTATNYMGSLPCDSGSTPFGQTFVGGLLGDLVTATANNLDLILGAVLGGGGGTDGGGNNSGGGNGDDDDDDDDKATEIDWSKIAIWGGVLVALGLGAYFIFRKK